MHILIIHQYYLGKGDGGGSRFNQFSKFWMRHGHKVTVLAGIVHYATGKKYHVFKGRLFTRERGEAGEEIIRCFVSEGHNSGFMGRMMAYLTFMVTSLLAGLFMVDRPDVVLATSPPLLVALAGVLLSKLRRVPFVFEVRDLWPLSAVECGTLTNPTLIRLAYWVERKAYQNAKLVNVLTPAFREELLKRRAVPINRISMIPNGADLDLMWPGQLDNEVRARHGLSGKFVVTYVGAHGLANRVGQLLDAAEKLTDLPDIVIMLVGDGMEKAMLIEQAKHRNLTNVLFVNSVSKSEISDYINASDVCTAVLLRNDAFKRVYPNKVFDYMCCERPIIIAIGGVARQLVESAQAGLYVEPENPEAFSQAVRQLRTQLDLRRQMGRNGRTFVEKYFDRGILAEKYLDVLEKIVRKEPWDVSPEFQ
jgi:glycosyltransferase involved in cell wall biosynthesis